MRAEADERAIWLDWAERAEWRFTSYYKYRFTFTETYSPPPESASEPFTATLSVGGDSADIYRYEVKAAPMKWAEVISGGDWDMTARDQDGNILFSTDPCLRGSP